MYKKKFRHIDDDVDVIVEKLSKGHLLGDEIPNVNLPDGESSFKVRIINSDTKSGQSNGYRLIYYVIKDDMEIYLLSIYYKKDKPNIKTIEIIDLIKKYCT